MNYPDYITEQIAAQLERARLCRIWGHVNVYTCKACGQRTATTDLVEGVTPFIIACPLCGGEAQSGMYRVLPGAGLRPTHGWYRPDSLDDLPVTSQTHLRLGGLLLRALNAAERAVVNL